MFKEEDKTSASARAVACCITFGGLSGISTAEMSRSEALATQVDNLRQELHQLQVENARLWDERPEAASAV